MKSVLAALIILAAPALLLAQTAAATAPAASAKPATAAPTVAKPKAVNPNSDAKKSPAAVRRSALKAVEEVTPIDGDPNIKLSAEDLEMAQRVFVGNIPCELGQSVTVTPSMRRAGFFAVQSAGSRFVMHPVESRTGAIRLEDPKAGAMWLQLGNKSMLMSQKLGKRLADECMSPAQVTLANDLKNNPRPGLLDGPTVAK